MMDGESLDAVRAGPMISGSNPLSDAGETAESSISPAVHVEQHHESHDFQKAPLLTVPSRTHGHTYRG